MYAVATIFLAAYLKMTLPGRTQCWSTRRSSWLVEGPRRRSLLAGATPPLAMAVASAGWGGAQTGHCSACWWTSTRTWWCTWTSSTHHRLCEVRAALARRRAALPAGGRTMGGLTCSPSPSVKPLRDGVGT
ncbi:hypothetical protein CHLRE_17g703495v5 [Chlamydomonas reinhardtii]|uniref:Uncharacterized protein n=1 Tax=Chlamydomonas reinhardtii TaxID=3055 RepID=A0A2K3CP54_CHLRE|nr:uncharacterized protein CHLRE_17g703495v5 [Chlamydomonas reinhardtii]PNW70048.1 hypothetical protein CHLRE_17g703495v5 [Chlamydomonas reinhardtii]